MACARSGSIFCWPRARVDFFFRRNDFFEDALCIVPVALEEALLRLRCVDFVGAVFDFVVLDTVVLLSEVRFEGLWLAYAGIRAQSIASVQIMLSAALRYPRL